MDYLLVLSIYIDAYSVINNCSTKYKIAKKNLTVCFCNYWFL